MCYANNSFGYKAVLQDWRACRARFGRGLTFRLVRLPKCDGFAVYVYRPDGTWYQDLFRWF
jgi:hypothetical protein